MSVETKCPVCAGTGLVALDGPYTPFGTVVKDANGYYFKRVVAGWVYFGDTHVFPYGFMKQPLVVIDEEPSHFLSQDYYVSKEAK